MPSFDTRDTTIDTRDFARRVRMHVLRMAHSGRSSHVASGLSICDILAVLYGSVLQVDPDQPDCPDRDRFILSKGHAGAALYATLAERGFFSTDLLRQHYANGSFFSGHVNHLGVPGVDLSTGSLGHGLSVAAGMAWHARRMRAAWRCYVLLSDGECDEGSVWEAAMFAGHQALSNLVVVIDYNRLQSLGTTDDTLTLEPLADKWSAFGWEVIGLDGHNHSSLRGALALDGRQDNRPRCIIANTVKGKGVSFMENQVVWHYRPPNADELQRALSEIAQ